MWVASWSCSHADPPHSVYRHVGEPSNRAKPIKMGSKLAIQMTSIKMASFRP